MGEMTRKIDAAYIRDLLLPAVVCSDPRGHLEISADIDDGSVHLKYGGRSARLFSAQEISQLPGNHDYRGDLKRVRDRLVD
jgi:hypothetical protein